MPQHKFPRLVSKGVFQESPQGIFRRSFTRVFADIVPQHAPKLFPRIFYWKSFQDKFPREFPRGLSMATNQSSFRNNVQNGSHNIISRWSFRWELTRRGFQDSWPRELSRRVVPDGLPKRVRLDSYPIKCSIKRKARGIHKLPGYFSRDSFKSPKEFPKRVVPESLST